MTPEEEKLEKMKERMGEYFTTSQKKLREDLAAIDDMSKAVGNFFDAFYKLDQIKRKEFLSIRAHYRKTFLEQIQQRPDYRSQLEYVSVQFTDLKLKIGDHRFNQQMYENFLNDIVLPFKVELIDMVRLENEVGKLIKDEPAIPPVVNASAKTSETQTTQKETEPEIVLPKKEPDQVFIPINIIDKPLETKTGKPMTNANHIATGRKFIWSDDRIPDLIGDFLLEHGCIFDYQIQTVKDFFRTTKCNSKIVFAGNANRLTTLLYELILAGYLKVSIDFLAERIEIIFIRKGDSTHALIAKKSVKADLKPTNITRRLKEGAPDHLNILAHLREKLTALS